jgi:amino acid transporter
VACYDGAGPRWLGVFSKKYGTPIAVNLLSGLLSTVVMVAAFSLAGSAAQYFSAVLGLAISTTTISYLGIFPALYLLRRKYPTLHRPYRAPGGLVGSAVISGVTLMWAILATIALLWPGALSAITGSVADDSLPAGFEGKRAAYEWTQFGPLIFMVLLGLAFYAMGAKTRASQVDVPLDIAAVEANQHFEVETN